MLRYPMTEGAKWAVDIDEILDALTIADQTEKLRSAEGN